MATTTGSNVSLKDAVSKRFQNFLVIHGVMKRVSNYIIQN